jgi:hypothetical protein
MSHQPSNHKEIIALIKKISGQANFIGTPRIYVDIFVGDLVAAVWFNQVVYWDDKTTEPIGFYKTYAEWKKELGLSEFQVRRVSKMCQDLELVNITFRKVYGTPKNHYLVIWPNLLKMIYLNLEKPDPEETKGSEITGSEGEDSASSMEGEGSAPSLNKKEIPSKSDKEDSLIQFPAIPEDRYWTSALEQLKDQMPRGNFEDYVRDTRAVRFDGNVLEILASSAYARDWLADRMTSTVSRLLIGIMNQTVQVEFVVTEEVSA